MGGARAAKLSPRSSQLTEVPPIFVPEGAAKTATEQRDNSGYSSNKTASAESRSCQLPTRHWRWRNARYVEFGNVFATERVFVSLVESNAV
jgi:hypothetical protein